MVNYIPKLTILESCSGIYLKHRADNSILGANERHAMLCTTAVIRIRPHVLHM